MNSSDEAQLLDDLVCLLITKERIKNVLEEKNLLEKVQLLKIFKSSENLPMNKIEGENFIELIQKEQLCKTTGMLFMSLIALMFFLSHQLS
jgi:hypothetical protein